jgi:hypothetical protein
VKIWSIPVGQSEKLIPVFIPSLAALLLNREQSKGAPLTHEEVMSIRDNAACMMVPEGVAWELEQSRGYRDIDPGRCWEEWNVLRSELEEGEGEA